jgi:hypothetical protein
MFDRKIVVSGVVMKLRPYTEKRLKQLVEVNQEINDFIEKNPDSTLDGIKSQRAEWYMRKASILWESDQYLDIDFFNSEDFEVSLLKETESFFLSNATYL